MSMWKMIRASFDMTKPPNLGRAVNGTVTEFPPERRSLLFPAQLPVGNRRHAPNCSVRSKPSLPGWCRSSLTRVRFPTNLRTTVTAPLPSQTIASTEDEVMKDTKSEKKAFPDVPSNGGEPGPRSSLLAWQPPGVVLFPPNGQSPALPNGVAAHPALTRPEFFQAALFSLLQAVNVATVCSSRPFMISVRSLTVFM